MIRGVYEKPLIEFLLKHFQQKGFSVEPHAQLNIAWANIISDVDLLAIRRNEIIAVEVKSKKDTFERAFTQLERVAPFVDKAYIATDNEVKANQYRQMDSAFGILYVDMIYAKVVVKKKAQNLVTMPSVELLTHMKRCCLRELAREFKIAPYQPKQYIALDIRRSVDTLTLKGRLKEMVVHTRCEHG